MSAVEGFRYTLRSQTPAEEIAARAARVMAQDSLPVQRKTKRKAKRRGRRPAPEFQTLDLRPMITQLSVDEEDGAARITFETRMHQGKLAKPKEILALLELDPHRTRVLKTATFLAESPVAAAR